MLFEAFYYLCVIDVSTVNPAYHRWMFWNSRAFAKKKHGSFNDAIISSVYIFTLIKRHRQHFIMSRLFYGAERAMSLSYEQGACSSAAVRRRAATVPPPRCHRRRLANTSQRQSFTHFYMFCLEPLHFYGTQTFSRGSLLNRIKYKSKPFYIHLSKTWGTAFTISIN